MSNTISEYLEELISQKSALAANLTTKGVSASSSEKLNTLVPKVLEIEGGEAVVQPLSVTQNGIYNPPTGVDGFAPVTVNVPTGSGDILTGSDTPSVNIGSNGDIYRQTIPMPNNVNFVEYLKSSGTQYIDTGIIADQGTDVTCESEYTGNNFIVGCRTGGPTSASKALIVIGSSNGICVYKSSDSGNISNYSSSVNIGTKCKSETKTCNDTIRRVTLIPRTDASNVYLRTISDFAADYSQILFGIGQGITPDKGIVKLYRVTYYQYGSPIHDYLPCLDGNGVACMWDNIAGEYVYNDGTGDFAYGNTITPTPLDDVYYLKENGAWHVIEQ